MAMDILALWGKTGNESSVYHPLLFHQLDVAAVCEQLLQHTPPWNEIPAHWIVYLAALHDIGKADPLFQAKDAESVVRLRNVRFSLPDSATGFRHEARTHTWMMNYLRFTCGWGRRAASVVAAALHGHHGDFRSQLCDNEEMEAHPERFMAWEEIRNECAQWLADVLEIQDWKADAFPHASTVGLRLAGLVVLADWIASNETLFRYQDFPRDLTPAEYWACARQEAARVVQGLGFPLLPLTRDETTKCFVDVWPECTTLRPTQRALELLACQGIPPGMVIIEAPMGEGKTEAAIYLAEHWQQQDGRTGAYIALPTAATSNQMFGRYARFMQRQHPEYGTPRLVHGMSWLMDDMVLEYAPQLDGEPGEEVRAQEWFRPSKRALLANAGVGTVDQALLAALHVKHGFLRLFGLTSKVLIIDEVHAYDAYMTTILECLLQWCRALQIPVILLSATLSSLQKHQLISAYGGNVHQSIGLEAYPLLTCVPLDGETYTVAVPYDDAPQRHVQLVRHPGLLEDAERTAHLAAELVRAGGCACVLVNSVAQAQDIFRQLPNAVPPETELFLFHARFRAERRQELERIVTGRFGKDTSNRPTRAIVVATQVVEQSLDVDFDVMITQLAPIDLVLQRSGRLHRHARASRPTGKEAVLHVLTPPEGEWELGVSGIIYQPEVLLRSLTLLLQRDAFHLPHDFRPLIEGCYVEQMENPAIPATVMADAVTKHRDAVAKARNKVEDYLIPAPNPDAFKLGEICHPFDEGEEGDGNDYFRASTRDGDDSRAVLILHDAEMQAVACAETPPSRTLLKRLFLQEVKLSAAKLRNLTDLQGTPVDFTGPKWLRHHLIIPMCDGRWRGLRDGHPVSILDDPALGIVIEEA